MPVPNVVVKPSDIEHVPLFLLADPDDDTSQPWVIRVTADGIEEELSIEFMTESRAAAEGTNT